MLFLTKISLKNYFYGYLRLEMYILYTSIIFKFKDILEMEDI